MPENCVYWSASERQHLLCCPDDLCRSGRPLCGLEEGIDYLEGDEGYPEGYWDGDDG